MNEIIRFPFQFDVHKLKEDLEQLERNDWIGHFVLENYEGEWSVIPLRGWVEAEHPIQMIASFPNMKEFKDSEYLLACPYFQEVLQSFQCELMSVRLMKLTPGSEIKEHCDPDLGPEADGIVRLHIPVLTNELVYFYLNDQRVVMKEGECWYMDLTLPHRVINRGNSDRVHIVIDAKLNDWLNGYLGFAPSSLPANH